MNGLQSGEWEVGGSGFRGRASVSGAVWQRLAAVVQLNWEGLIIIVPPRSPALYPPNTRPCLTGSSAL